MACTECGHRYLNPRPVEAELGRIPDADEKVDWAAYYTDVAEAERFVAETGVNEVMVVSAIYEHEARTRSYELLAGAVAAA